jgi:ADP-ribose pyrophosphatase YjhB (NUDIX family)
VLIVPIDDGVLVIRRAIEPHVGKLALPGGFVNLGESWQEAAARELWEETGIRVEPDAVRDFRVTSTDDGMLLVFGIAPPLRITELPTFVPTDETSERSMVNEPIDLAFPLHTDALRAYFARAR